MSEAALYQQILGLRAPGVVSSVQLDELHQRIIVTHSARVKRARM